MVKQRKQADFVAAGRQNHSVTQGGLLSRREVNLVYKTVVIKYSPKAKEMALKVEETANEMEKEGFELVSCSIMPSSKGILIFKKIRDDEVSE